MFARVLLLQECCFLYKEQVLPYLTDCHSLLSYDLQGKYNCSIFESIFVAQSPITEGRKQSVISVCSVWKCFFREDILSDKQLKVAADYWLMNRSFGSTLIQFGIWKSWLWSGSTLCKRSFWTLILLQFLILDRTFILSMLLYIENYLRTQWYDMSQYS